MKMIYDTLDEPLFSKEDEGSVSGDLLPFDRAKLLERLVQAKEKSDANDRKNWVHIFSIALLSFVLLCLIVFASVEYVVEIENEYVKEIFDFFKYIATTLMGFLFASNKKEG